MTANIVSPLESTVEKHIDSTSRLVRRVDLALSLLIVVSMLFGGLFLAMIADHWLLKEGLSKTLRFGIFAALFAAAGFYIYWKIVPLFLYPINPIYTADLIERDVSTFKNSLINWLLLRQEREEKENVPNDKMNERMFDGIVRTAAANVQTVPAGHAVDVRRLIWMGTVFTVLLIMFIAYAVLSPKNPFTSFGRLLLPLSGIERPQAAQFRNVNPGDATVLQGETLIISAEVISRSSEPVYLVFSTDDGLAVQQRIPMSLPEGKLAFEAPFPPGKQGAERGFNSSVDYWIAQGESRSKQYRIDVLPAASVEIVSLQYDFPDYTGLPTETIEHGGDIRALEGTSVTVAVRSTLPLQKIDLVFDDNPAHNISMRVVDTQRTEARGTFSLRPPFPHKTFSFRATDANGHASRRSGIYRIEVIPDQPPRVQWADVAENLRDVAQIDLPLNETLQLPIQAEDPDFALRYLRFKTESLGKRIPDVQLLQSSTTGPTNHRGQIKRTIPFSPAEKRLAVGDTADIWVEATDTKLPDANVSSTRRIKINVIDPTAQENNDPPQDKNGEGEPDQQDKGTDTTDKSQPQERAEGSEGEGTEGQNPDEQDPSGQNPNEQNPDEQHTSEGDQSNPDGQGQKQNDPSEGSEGEQQGGQPDSSQGNADTETSGSEAKEQPDGGQENNATDQSGANQPTEAKQPENGQPTGGQPEKGEGAEGERTGNESTQQPSVNPDTQDGDAMERIIEQMRKDGAFSDENPLSRNDQQRIRSNTLDPNSLNRSNQGDDPTNPEPSNRPSEATSQDRQGQNQQEQQGQNQPEQGQQQNQSDKPNEGTAETGRSSEQDASSGDQQGSPQQNSPQGGQEQNAQGSQPQQGDASGGQEQGGGQPGATEGNGGAEGNAGGESTAGQQPSGSNSPDSHSGNADSGHSGSQATGGTNGSGGMERNTTPDDPNLEHANKVTDLVLDYLENQLKDKPSDELLKRLNWTEEQLRQFYDKWQKMSQERQQPPREDGTSAWEELLKSIGLLRPHQHRPALQDSQARRQDNQNITETLRFETPAALQERYKNYNNNIGK
jgi:hypothetical protein